MKFIATLAALTAGIVLSVTPAAARTFDAFGYEARSRDRRAKSRRTPRRRDSVRTRCNVRRWRIIGVPTISRNGTSAGAPHCATTQSGAPRGTQPSTSFRGKPRPYGGKVSSGFRLAPE